MDHKINILTFIITLLSSTFSLAETKGYFSTHIHDAIKINKHRREIYSKITNKHSLSISSTLIFFEKLSILFAKHFDRKAKEYEIKGVPLLSLDYIDMNKIPEFQERIEKPSTSYSQIPRIKIFRIKRWLKKALRDEGFHGLEIQAAKELEAIKRHSPYNSMVKHVLEAIIRSAHLAPLYVNLSLEKDLASPDKLLKKHLRFQITGLPISYFLDRKAGKLIEQGVGILYQDVPHIPLPTENELKLL